MFRLAPVVCRGMIKVTTVGGKVHEGLVYAIDPLSKCLAMKKEQGSFIIISPSQISNIQGDLSSISVPDLTKLGINPKTAEKREEIALKQVRKCISALNSSVNEETQSLFDRINFVFPCSWDGTSIIVLDEYRINPPYDAVTIMQDCDGSGIDRVIKVLEGERRKLNAAKM